MATRKKKTTRRRKATKTKTPARKRTDKAKCGASEAKTPKPVAETPKPVAETPKPAVETPKPVFKILPRKTGWIEVSYVGQGIFVHREAGVFVPGTRTRLRVHLANQLRGVEGIRLAG